jgi:3-oxoacyl-[acyl-carrier protein] reductase
MADNDLKGKVALITGASRGIGQHIALEMVKAGAIVGINYMKDEDGIQKTMDLIRNMGGYGKKYKGDVRDFSTSQEMINNMISDFGKIDILVNNAGVSQIGLLIDSNEEDYNHILDSNFRSVYNCTHAVLNHMISRRSGSIINISSIWGNVGASCEVLYSASKGAINAFTMALGKELAPSNIRVNGIAPGVIDTSMNSYFSDEEIRQLKEEIPMDRFGKPQEIGKLAVFLASESSSYITSKIITIDGGLL